MSRIVLLKSRLNYQGGLEKYTLRLAQAFANHGCEVTLLTTGKKPTIKDIRVLSLAKDSKFSLYRIIHFNKLCQKWLKANPHKIIFSLERTPFQTHYRAGEGVHATYLKQRAFTDSLFKQISFHINPLHLTLLRNEKKAFEHPELKVLFTNSNMVRQEILNTYATPPQKIVTIHNGVEWYELEKKFEESLIYPRKRPFHFLFIGNNYLRKGLTPLLNGLALLSAYDFQLTVVGKDKKSILFQKQAVALGLEKHIRFIGMQTPTYPFYQDADALVIPSFYDPFANVTVEALAMGLFVVSSKFNGGHEILTPKNGCVIDDITSPKSIAQSLEKALSHPKTAERARSIRNSIRELDFSNQLDKMVRLTLNT